MSALDEYRKAKEIKHAIEHNSRGSLRLKFDRPMRSDPGFSNTECIELLDSDKLYRMVMDILQERIDRLRAIAMDEAHALLGERP